MARVTEEHIQARTNQILDAAWACFARSGYHQATMQDIATEAGISAGAIYRYFPGKDAVMKAIFERGQAARHALVELVRTQTAEPLGALRTIGGYMMAAFRDPDFETDARISAEVWPEVLRNRVLAANLKNDLDYWRTVVTQLLAAARARGEVPAHVNPEALAVLFICAYEGLRHYMLVDPEHFTPERLTEAEWTLFGTESRDQLNELLAELRPPPTAAPARGARKRKVAS